MPLVSFLTNFFKFIYLSWYISISKGTFLKIQTKQKFINNLNWVFRWNPLSFNIECEFHFILDWTNVSMSVFFTFVSSVSFWYTHFFFEDNAKFRLELKSTTCIPKKICIWTNKPKTFKYRRLLICDSTGLGNVRLLSPTLNHINFWVIFDSTYPHKKKSIVIISRLKTFTSFPKVYDLF